MAESLPTVHITQCNGPNAYRIKGHFVATGDTSGGMPVYRKRDGDYVLHYWIHTSQWIVAGSSDFTLQTGRGWAVLESSPLLHSALSKSNWHVAAGAKLAMCVEAFAYGL